ncbi:MAG: tetratricopeptide repeat protein, partial [Gammaproteobacteria bacterium]
AEAEQGYLEFLRLHPEEVTALHWLGLLYAEQGELDKAQYYIEQAIALSPDEPTFVLHLANIFKAKQLLPQAQQLLETLVSQHANFPAAFNNLGTIYVAQGKWQPAIDAYQAAIHLQSNYADAYYNLGLALSKAGRQREAENVFSSLLELNPQHVGGHFQLGRLFMQQNQYPDAIEHFSKIEQAHPFHFETQTNLATCYLALGQLNEAKAHYLKALTITANDTQVLFNLGVIQAQQGFIQEAMDFYRQVVQIDADAYDAHNNLAYLYLMMKENKAALSHLRDMLRLQPNNEAVRHTMHILAQDKKLSQSPPDYVRSLFNSYAGHYDAHLVKTLHYHLPALFYKMIQTIPGDKSEAWDIVDLGCGTGLCGEEFKPLAKSLVGVDLSEKMLAVAARKKLYDQLVLSDILSFLEKTDKKYHLIMAGDALVYTGDLAPLFAAAANTLKAGGFFIFNAEISEKEDYLLTTSGRFAHSRAYLDQLALQNQLIILQYQVAVIRTQDQQPVWGHLYLCGNTTYPSA